jgi:tRNA pseudouridine38-40 synthase
MPRYRLTIEYDGGPFVGWQRQANGVSVQEAVEAAVARFVGQPVAVTGAGRTDAGVHASGQVAHLDLPVPRPPATIRDAINFHLRPQPVAVLAAEPVSDAFHARFSAVGRRYRYRIVNRKPPLTLDAGRAWWVPVPLDEARMAAAARILVGHHDFTSFRSAACQAASPVKTLDRLDVRRAEAVIEVVAEARSFLHNQVRILVGTLKRVGDGAWPVERVAAALAARDRRHAGPTAPACGLCLAGVEYPPHPG